MLQIGCNELEHHHGLIAAPSCLIAVLYPLLSILLQAKSGDVPPNVAEARQWIANWKAKQGGGAPADNGASTSSSSAASSSSSSDASNNGGGKEVPANVAEARQWIANWKAKQEGGDGGKASSAKAADAVGEASKAVEEAAGEASDAIGNVFANLFGGFGKK